MIYVYAVLLCILNIVFWVAIVFGLPGTWLMILAAAVTDWWLADTPMFGTPVLLAAVGLATLGEILEFFLSAAGARGAGGSRRGAALAIVGAIVGAIMGTPIPVPLLGTLVGACVGAFVGSLIGDIWAGRPIFHGLEAGKGAAVGRFWGTISKLIVGGVIVVVLGVAAFA
ncbi:MAG: DUF456 family protein [Gammaproteobacteria bacterium]|jgi:uncharacterized protein YqgC (DUF456 family)